MAIAQLPESPKIHKLPLYKYVDAVRWLPPISALDRHAVIASFDSDSGSPAIEIHSISPSKTPTLASAYAPLSSRISSLKSTSFAHRPVIAASTHLGSFHIMAVDPADLSIEPVAEEELHSGGASCVDLVDGGVDCVSVGEDGRVNLVSLGEAQLKKARVFDANGLVSYTAARWASPSEFATGGYGFSLHWWDRRKPGGPVSQFKCDRVHEKASGIVHSIDIHPSRKHTCLAGGSAGTIFAWDLRRQQQPIILSGVGMGEGVTSSVSESEIWEIQYDRSISPSNVGTRMLPVMICSEDGILAVVKEGEEPVELLAEPCAINSFDIDRQNPSEVICSLEWESIAILSRPKPK
ncbi:nuclear pore complex protein NUP43 isoform X1 [Syzygium oleosum]|uniref:nuclear pore complex protein NUP43 isoform X1 n=1 Tax=Syzygium oleosum TaxID=219896 RepID=UPI0011D2ACBF|nr:nuclear pore complex protein NUP43 isoform X1 [Syzygium oleosum]